MLMAWAGYLEQAMPGVTQKQIAAAAGVDQSTVSRWRRGAGQPSAQTVIRLARRLNLSPTQALVAAGHLTADEANAEVTYTAPADLSDDELIETLQSRLRATRSAG